MMDQVRPDLCELVGVAMSASVLVIDPDRDETPLLRVAAVGGAALQIAGARDVERPWQPSERDRIEARLAPLLWRLKFGRDGGTETALEAVHLFARWMAGTHTWRTSPPSGEFAHRFAARVIFEWLSDRCPACGGTGLQELLRSGQTRKPQRFNDRSVRHVSCRACQGSTHARPNSMDRARTLEVSLAEMRATWNIRLDKSGEHLRAIARRLQRPLQFQLERGKNRA
jgi:hypothetical protein